MANSFNSLLRVPSAVALASVLQYVGWYRRNMFRISIADTPSRRTLIVEGTLIGAWIAELGTTWRNASQELDGRRMVIDLSNLTVISRDGEDAIFDLMQRGAKFSCCGVLTKHVLKRLARRTERESPRR